MRPVIRPIALAALLLAATLPAAAQSLFTPVARVNDSVVTAYELEQRTRFLTLLNAPGDVRADALDRLIEERLQLQAADRQDVTVTEEELLAGMEEFAGRANLGVEEFVRALEEAGVAEETFRDFVLAGLAWRGVVRERFGPVAEPDALDLERAASEVAPQAGVRVLLSEIVLPTTTPAATAQARERAAELSRISSIDAFSAAARRYSAAPSAERGGRVDWIPLANLPPAVASEVLTLRPGEVTPPVPVGNAVAVFQLRAIEEGAAAAGNVSVDYAEYLIPGGRSPDALARAARIEARVDTCDDLYGLAKGQPESRLQRTDATLAEVPRDVAAELARLDPGEVSTAIARGDALVFLMLCSRGLAEGPSLADAAVANRLRGERLTGFAASYLAELKADAIIERTN